MDELDRVSIQTGILINQVLDMWKANEPLNPEIATDFIYSVLDLKLQWAGLRTIVPDYLIVIVSILANGNPGTSQVMLKEILMHSRKDTYQHYKDGKAISPSVFVAWYFNQHCIPTMSNPEIASKYSRIWDEQKLSDGDNGVDTREYWHELMVEHLDGANLPYNKRWLNKRIQGR